MTHRFRHRVLAALLFILASGLADPASAASAPLAGELPPLSDPPTGEYRPGKFVWIDLVTADIARARRFYGELFRWSFADVSGGSRPYTLVYSAGYAVAGIAQRATAAQQAPSARWIAFMSVPDVAGAAKQVTDKGGKVLIPPTPVPGRGDMAVLADPDDAPFGVVHSSSGDPPDYLPDVGDFIWALYQSPDATRAAAFYQNLANYEVVPDDRFDNAPHFILAAAGFARASLVEIPPGRAFPPDWLYFVRVTDMAASVARAVELGGRVIVAPDAAILDGRMAVIADPEGAPLGLLKWNEESGEGN